ncbi:hypothetical protein MLD38_013850 [Melastoma candidum]|uniref:Uncharacterized protein n=1 Tax=Melastoma candidum TaxID=119954 RepID=A0ACB9RF27_9MYRT|nr:hypothetical protein MLD38_013850 [Melastoma candidum]
MTHFLSLLLVPSMAVILVQASQMNPDDINHLWLHLKYNLVSVVICSAFLVFGTTCLRHDSPQDRSSWWITPATALPIISRSESGGAAILLSNKSADRRRAKYKLVHVVRTHRGADDKAFRCVYQEQDDAGKTGVSLSKDLMAIAGDALKTNITTLGPLVLPISEQLLFFATLVVKKFFNAKVKPYIPDFKLAFDHFCIHAGGRAVIDELEKNLQLHQIHVEASRMTLHRFGNTSSSSIWYELAYTEAKGRMRKGNRVWQIAFGSGFKCNSAVWQALRHVKPSPNSPWKDCIDKYPVELTM